VRHLISHQGGVLDRTDWDGGEGDAELASFTYGTFADEVFFMSPPGSFWNYSNPNFALAGLVTEELDARAWPDLMREDLFTPLGMSRTFLRRDEVLADGDFAQSYGFTASDLNGNFASQGVVPLDEVPDPGWLRPAGLAWTTPTQMMSWADFLLRGNPAVLSDALRSEITAEQVDTLYQSGNLHYGYGMFVSRGFLTLDGVYYPTTVWDHGGNTLSFTNLFYVLPEHDFAIAICSSGYATDFNRSVDVAITSLVDLPAPVEAPAYEIDPSTFGRHVGEYDDPFANGRFNVTLEGGQLRVDAPDLEAFGLDIEPVLQPISSEIFLMTVDGTPYEITFVPGAPGGDSQFVRNRGFVFTRVPVPPPGLPAPDGASAAAAGSGG
jgi:CubicO group peptidase (beta-lactamase class C family)